MGFRKDISDDLKRTINLDCSQKNERGVLRDILEVL